MDQTNPTSWDLASNPLVLKLIDLALLEDVPHGDVTTRLVVPQNAEAHGAIVAREPGVLAGIEIAKAVFKAVDPSIVYTSRHADGNTFAVGTRLVEVTGPARSVITAERTALNFVQRLSGIATTTASYVNELKGLPTRLVDTRKTIPGWRMLCKYAVHVGGGFSHRYSLSDGVLIKENHLAMSATLTDAVRGAIAGAPHTMRVEVEVETLQQLDEALAAGAEAILLDNMTCDQLAEAVRRTNGRAILEASGGIKLENLRATAETGVDIISTGATVADARPIDIAFDISVAPA